MSARRTGATGDVSTPRRGTPYKNSAPHRRDSQIVRRLLSIDTKKKHLKEKTVRMPTLSRGNHHSQPDRERSQSDPTKPRQLSRTSSRWGTGGGGHTPTTMIKRHAQREHEQKRLQTNLACTGRLAPFPSGMSPVARTTQCRSPDFRRVVSALYFQFRMPPGLRATMGMSFLRSSSVDLGRQKNENKCGSGAFFGVSVGRDVWASRFRCYIIGVSVRASRSCRFYM